MCKWLKCFVYVNGVFLLASHHALLCNIYSVKCIALQNNGISTLTEECCEAYRVYQMALSKYLIDLRNGHTQGMVCVRLHANV